VHRDDGVPLVVGHLEEQVVADDAGVVHQYRRRSELVGDPGDRRRHLLGVGDVGPRAQRAATELGDLVDGRLAGGLVEVEDGDVEPVGGQPQRGGSSGLLRQCRAPAA
jgi:hypothetical protein